MFKRKMWTSDAWIPSWHIFSDKIKRFIHRQNLNTKAITN